MNSLRETDRKDLLFTRKGEVRNFERRQETIAKRNSLNRHKKYTISQKKYRYLERTEGKGDNGKECIEGRGDNGKECTEGRGDNGKECTEGRGDNGKECTEGRGDNDKECTEGRGDNGEEYIN